MLYTALQCVLILILVVYYILKLKLNYWKRKGVVHIKPSFIFGNYKDYILLKKQIGFIAQDLCNKFPDEPYVGSYFGTEPALIVQDPELISLIMVQDFYHFNGREITKYKDSEPLNQQLFFTGDNLWKLLRQNLTPFFSTAKLKNMFCFIQNCSETLEEILKKEISISPNREVKNIAIRYIMDCLGYCTYGINTEVMEKNVDTNPFAVVGQKIFCRTEYSRRKVVFRAIWPSIFYGLGFQLFTPKISNFFFQTYKDITKSKQRKPSSKHDFLDHFLSWKTKSILTGSNLNQKLESSIPFSIEVNDELIVAQSIQLFGAGFETSSAVISFCLFELAKSKEVQAKLIEEIDDYFVKNLDKIEYDCVHDLPYLDACINETMRRYPVTSIIAREVMRNYILPSGLQLEKGVRIHIPVQYLHHHPKYFPDPMKFCPERFLGDAKKNLIPFTFLPFGAGPRTCLGARFAKMTMIPAFLTIFKDYEIELMEGMPTTLNILPGSFVTQAADDIRLKFIRRNK